MPCLGQRLRAVLRAVALLFALNTDGTSFTILHNFTALNYYTNSDGSVPLGVISSGKVLYGTTAGGGSSRNGTIFAVKTNGGDFTTIHNFTAVIPSYPGILYTNQDGAGPL